MRTTLTHNNVQVHASSSGVQIAFLRRVPSPYLNAEEARQLARMLYAAVQTHEKYLKEDSKP